MAKPRNDVGSIAITISTTQQVRQALQGLVKTGFYGKNPAEAAERLLASVLEGYVRDGRLRTQRRKASSRGVEEAV